MQISFYWTLEVSFVQVAFLVSQISLLCSIHIALKNMRYCILRFPSSVTCSYLYLDLLFALPLCSLTSVQRNTCSKRNVWWLTVISSWQLYGSHSFRSSICFRSNLPTSTVSKIRPGFISSSTLDHLYCSE